MQGSRSRSLYRPFVLSTCTCSLTVRLVFDQTRGQGYPVAPPCLPLCVSLPLCQSVCLSFCMSLSLSLSPSHTNTHTNTQTLSRADPQQKWNLQLQVYIHPLLKTSVQNMEATPNCNPMVHINSSRTEKRFCKVVESRQYFVNTFVPGNYFKILRCNTEIGAVSSFKRGEFYDVYQEIALAKIIHGFRD